MDPRRFDSLTRSLAAPRSRRGLLGGLAAIAAGLLGARATDAQVTQAQCGNKACAANPGVCPGGCVCCVFGNGNSRCRPAGQCTGTVTSPTTTTTTTAAPTTTTTTTAPTTTTTTTAPPPCAGLADGASCGTGLVCSGGRCIGNGLCPTGDAFCAGGSPECGGQVACGAARKCAATPEGGATCVYRDLGDFCAAGPCASSAECADGFVCLPAGGSPCCEGHTQGTCFAVCEIVAASRMAAPTGGDGSFPIVA